MKLPLAPRWLWHIYGVIGMMTILGTSSKFLGGFLVATAAIALLIRDKYG